MTKYQIKLINIGRERFNHTFIKEFAGIDALRNAVSFALDECGKHLISSAVSLELDKNEKAWTLFAGYHAVGKVEIKIQHKHSWIKAQ